MSDTEPQRHEVGSIGWVDAFRSYLEQHVEPEDLVGITFTASFELTDPPARLVSEQRDKVGWTIQIHDGRLEVGDTPLPVSDASLIADYATFAPTYRLNMQDDAAFIRNERPKLIEAGLCKIAGNPMPIRHITLKANLREGFYNVYSA